MNIKNIIFPHRHPFGTHLLHIHWIIYTCGIAFILHIVFYILFFKSNDIIPLLITILIPIINFLLMLLKILILTSQF